MKIYRLATLLVLALLLGACQPLATPTPVPAISGAAAEATVEPSPTSRPTAVPTAAAAIAPTQAATPAVSQGGTLPEPALFDVAWDDRSPFAAGLVGGAQDVLEQLPGASVYHVDLTVPDDLTRLNGRQEVLYTNREDVALDQVVFRLFPNLTGGSVAVSNLTVNGQRVEPAYELNDSAMLVPLSQPLQPGEQAVFAMDFDVTVPTDESSNYGTFAYLSDVLALAHVYPMIAVYDDEGWNAEIPPQSGDIVYADASFFLWRVTAPADLEVVASGVQVDRQIEDGQQVLTFAAGPARDFYLAASDAYTLTSETVGETTVNSYTPRDLAQGSRLAVDWATAAMDSYQDHFGPYPYTELDLVSTGTTALGVEYPGIIAINQTIYSDDRQRYLESTTAHEVAHQWFYNVVGNDQVDEPWIDEAMAQYATLLYYDDAYGQAGYDGFRQSLVDRWNRVDQADIPIGMPVARYPDVEYGAIVYGRGPLFFEALEKEMGQEAFDAFLRDYYSSFRWGIATADGLRTLAEAHCQCDLGPLFEAWVYSD